MEERACLRKLEKENEGKAEIISFSLRETDQNIFYIHCHITKSAINEDGDAYATPV